MDNSKIDARGEGIFFSLFFSQVLTSVMASWMKLPLTVFSHRVGLLPSSVHWMIPLALPDTASHLHCGPDTRPGQSTGEWIIICPLLLNLDSGLPKVEAISYSPLYYRIWRVSTCCGNLTCVLCCKELIGKEGLSALAGWKGRPHAIMNTIWPFVFLLKVGEIYWYSKWF